MIDFYNGELTDILPHQVASGAEYRAISYCLHKALQQFQQKADATRVYSYIDNLDDTVLDHLAAELRSQYYNKNLPVETKRDIIKNTLLWFRNAGTPAAVENVIATIFAPGKVQEWFEFSGTPGTFKAKIDVSAAQVVENTARELMESIASVKNTRSKLIEIDFTGQQKAALDFSSGIMAAATITIGG